MKIRLSAFFVHRVELFIWELPLKIWVRSSFGMLIATCIPLATAIDRHICVDGKRFRGFLDWLFSLSKSVVKESEHVERRSIRVVCMNGRELNCCYSCNFEGDKDRIKLGLNCVCRTSYQLVWFSERDGCCFRHAIWFSWARNVMLFRETATVSVDTNESKSDIVQDRFVKKRW